MSSQSYSSTSYSSYSTSSSSSSTNGQTQGTAYRQETHSNPSGTSVQTTQQNIGQPAVQETRHYDPHGRELLNPANGGNSQGRIEDVTEESDTDKLYRERMEDEYAKREGGA